MALTPSLKKGFTLIELIVTVSVFVLLSASLLDNYRTTTKSLALNSLANLIVTDIRRAQTYGISSIDYAPSEDYYYGISFDETYPNSYMLFRSPVSDNALNDSSGPDCPNSSECVERMTIKGGTRITEICGNKKNGGCKNVDILHIAFKRPDPEASLKGTIGASIHSFSDAEITLTSEDGTIAKTIVIWSTGLITVE